MIYGTITQKDHTRRWVLREGAPKKTSADSERQMGSRANRSLVIAKAVIWRGENSDKYYMLSTQNVKVNGIAIEKQ